MNISTKTFLTIAILGSLALGVGVKTVLANQSHPSSGVISVQDNNQNHPQEVSDGDGEANDATEPPESIISQQNTKETDENEANENANDSDRTHEDSE
jgi:hypothetical protein